MLDIVTLPTKSLREKSKEIDLDFLLSTETQKLIDEMILKMYKSDGIGLAAPQVGHNIRICIIGKDYEKKMKEDLILINPTWIKTSKKKNTEMEGCLSVPYTFGKVVRLTNIDVEALDRQGNKISFSAKKFLARVIQHEVDHLDGILFVDKATDICKEEMDTGMSNLVCPADLEAEHSLKI
ncbi:MAG: peptide deformylase [bacterium]|nr:peptide deformylase [bacterium]